MATDCSAWSTVSRGRPSPLAGLFRTLLLLALCCGAAAVAAQPAPPSPPATPSQTLLPVQTLPITLPNGDQADVYAPRLSPAERQALEHPFAVVALLQGAAVDKSHYARLGNAIAAQGFVVVAPNHLRSVPPFPSPVLFSEVGVVSQVYQAMVAADADTQSPLHGLVDLKTMGLIGHSLGGSVGLYAIAGVCVPGICTESSAHYTRPPALRAAVLYGANVVGADGAVTDLDTAGVAVALVQGSQDGVALPEKAAPSYKTLEPRRALITLTGANHYAICDANNPPGARPDPKAPALTQAQANDAVADWIALWLRAHLRDDQEAQRRLQDAGRAPDGVVTLVTE